MNLSKKRKRFPKEFIIRDLNMDDTEKIIETITDIYGTEYPDKEFYDSDVVQHFIKKVSAPKGGAWKGIFHGDLLIGQMLAYVENNAAFSKIGMTRKEYENYGIMKKLIMEMTKEVILKYGAENFKCIYAIAEHSNTVMLNFFKRFGYDWLGDTPEYDKDKYFSIFGRVFFDLEIKKVSLHPKFYNSIQEHFSKIEFKYRDLIKIDYSFYQEFGGKNEDACKIKLISSSYPIEHGIFIGSKQVAHFFENPFTKSWYDFIFIENIDYSTKEKVMIKLLNKYRKNQDITVLTITVDCVDLSFQDILVNMGFKFCAFFPFYSNFRDNLLLGLSKYW